MSQFAFKRTGDADYPRHLKILLQGPPKSGKTMFISTAPNVVVAACEAGLASIAHLDVAYVPIDGTDKLQNLEMILRDDTLREAAAKQLGLPKIETVAIDTLDAWQEILKREILAENRRTQMQQADWGTLKERMAAVLKRFVTLPVNVIFTVHTTTTQDDESRLIYAPALQGSIKDEIAGYVDYSLLAFRDRQTGRDGVSRVSYHVKTEGDLKNPHLGNRSAGRLPEIAQPNFEVLHGLHFSAIPTRVAAEEVAQRSSQVTVVPRGISPAAAQAEAADYPIQIELNRRTDVVAANVQAASRTKPVAVVELPRPAPTGVPEDDPHGPINVSGISMLTKSYVEHGLIVPEDLDSWTLGRARNIAKWFMAWKADKVAGNPVTRDDLIAGLDAHEGFFGEMEGVKQGTGDIKAPTRPKPTPEDAVVEQVKPAPDEAEDAALSLLQKELGAVEIGYTAKPDAKCEECGKPVDDPDVASLAVIKFKRPMCVADYKVALQATKE